jgi:hypothetical protein
MRALSAMVTVGLMLVGFSFAAAKSSDPNAALDSREIVLVTVGNAAAARREAIHASLVLGIPVAFETTKALPARRSYAGAVVAARRGGGGRIVISSFLGAEAELPSALREARKHYPRATVVRVASPPVTREGEPMDDSSDVAYFGSEVLIVASSKSYDVARRAAQAFALVSGVPYDSNGMIFDKKRGLIWPDDSRDEAWAGAYAPRRDDECNGHLCVTVERSEFYEGLEPKLYIVVAGLLGHDEVDERLGDARRFARDAYVRETVLYMGCMH